MIGGAAVDWPAPPGVRTFVTERAGGVSTGAWAALNLALHVGDSAAAVVENRARLAAHLGLPSPPCWLTQVHGVTVREISAADAGHANPPVADAAVTRQRGAVCAVMTADCLPVLFAAADGRVVGVAHAGWRGLLAGVLEATLAALAVPPAAVLAWIGPGISQPHFEVGPEVRQAFVDAAPAAAAAFTANARGRWQADLEGLARQRLAHAGVQQVSGGGQCTYAEANRFFSHRRQAPCGRMATLIWLD